MRTVDPSEPELLYRASNSFVDPFSQVIDLLRPHATRWGSLTGVGDWSLSFRKRDDLLFCWMEEGECLLERVGEETARLLPGDCAFIRTSSTFVLTTDTNMEPQDSEAVVAAAGTVELVLGSGAARRTVLRSGRFEFNTANETLLWSLLPSLLHIRADQQVSSRLRTLLRMNEAEGRTPGPGSSFAISRLMELTLLEVLRSELPRVSPESRGLLSGLADPVVAKALAAMHQHVAAAWSVAKLARLCGVSRSTFAARFQEVVGFGPMEYLSHWRLAVARDELAKGNKTIAEIALAVGFQSSSAFSTAFTRLEGRSPRQFARDLPFELLVEPKHIASAKE